MYTEAELLKSHRLGHIMLSDYEIQRQHTVAQNNEKLASLGLLPGDGLVSHRRKQPDLEQTGGARKKRRAVAPPPASPQRRSARVKREPAAKLYIEDEDVSGKVVVGGADAAQLEAEALAEAAEVDPDALPTSPSQLTENEREVYEVIREVRNAKARSLQRSMFIVCQNRTMVEMVRTLPTTEEELGELYGMGQLKVERYGALLLEALQPHVDQLRAEHVMGTGAAREAVLVD